MARGWTWYEMWRTVVWELVCVGGGGGGVYTQWVTLGDIWLCIVLHGVHGCQGKTTGAYLLPSAGLSTAHLHVDGKSMGSLRCTINITNDQFKLALAALLKKAHSRGGQGWTTTEKVPQGRYTCRSNYIGSHVTMWGNAAGHDVLYVGEGRQPYRQPKVGTKMYLICPGMSIIWQKSWINLKKLLQREVTEQRSHETVFMPNLLWRIIVLESANLVAE